jgi:hypothetical protein
MLLSTRMAVITVGNGCSSGDCVSSESPIEIQRLSILRLYEDIHGYASEAMLLPW